MKWKLKEVSGASFLKYRTTEECSHFMMQEKRIGNPKARIVTKPGGNGSVVVCTAPSISDLSEPWQMCHHLVPPKDSKGRVDKTALFTMFQSYITPPNASGRRVSLSIPSPPLGPVRNSRRLSLTSSNDAFHFPSSPMSIASDTTYFSDECSTSHELMPYSASAGGLSDSPPQYMPPIRASGTVPLTESALKQFLAQSGNNDGRTRSLHDIDVPLPPLCHDSFPINSMFGPMLDVFETYAFALIFLYFVVLRLCTWPVFLAFAIPGMWFGHRLLYACTRKKLDAK